MPMAGPSRYSRFPATRVFSFLGSVGPAASCALCRDTAMGGLSMNRFLTHVKQFLKSEDGPTAVEYAVMLALIIVVCLTAITTLGGNASNTFQNVALNTAVAGS